LSYPHFGPKNTRSNFLSVSDYFKFTMSILQFSIVLQTHIVLSLSLNFLALQVLKKEFLKPLHIFLHFVPIFCIKSYKRVFWSFPTKEPILVPIICPWVFSTCLPESLIKFCPKIVLVLHFESVWVVLVLRGILVFSQRTIFDREVF